MASQSSDLASVNDDHNMDTSITIKTEIMDVPEHTIFQINQKVKSEPGNLEHYFEVNHSNIKNEPSISNQENAVYYEVPLEKEPTNLEPAPSTIAQDIEERILEKQPEDCYRQEKNTTNLEQEQHRIKEALKLDPIIIKLEPEFPDEIPKNTDKKPQSEPTTNIIEDNEDEDMKIKIEHNIQAESEKSIVTKQETVNKMLSTIKVELEHDHDAIETELILRNINTVYTDDNNGELIDQQPEKVKIGCINNIKNKAQNRLPSTGIAVRKPIFRNTSCKIESKDMSNIHCKVMKTSKSSKKRSVHHSLMSQERLFVCQYCERGFMSKYSLERHIRSHSKEKQCNVSLEGHKSTHADEWPHPCRMCDRKYKMKSQMIAHYRRFHGVKQPPFDEPNDCPVSSIPEVKKKLVASKISHEVKNKCDVCCKLMQTSKSLKKHMAIHSGERPFVCQYCDRDFVSKYSMERHIRIHTNQKEYLCYVCNTKFDNRDSLDEHKSIHADEWPHPCRMCDKKYKIKSQMMAHRRNIHEGIPRAKRKTSRKIADEVMCKCDVCGKLMRTSKSLKKHMAQHSGERPFVCQYCERDFVSKYSLERHIRIHTEEKEYLCYVCNTKFGTKDSLDEHKLIHADEWPHPCPMCDKKYKIKGQMRAHYRRIHEGKKPLDKPNDCPICKKTIYIEKSFISHMQKHKGIAPTCGQCGKQFTKNAALLVHMRSHTGETPFACNVCDRKLKTKSHLKMHLRTHTAEKKHECDVCGKLFSERFHLNGHKVVHEAKTFECKPCDKKFAWKASYVNHQKIHHPDSYSEFTCHHCGKSFGLKSYLRQHIVYVCYPSVMNIKVPVRKRKRRRKVISEDWNGDGV